MEVDRVFSRVVLERWKDWREDVVSTNAESSWSVRMSNAYDSGLSRPLIKIAGMRSTCFIDNTRVSDLTSLTTLRPHPWSR